MATEPPWMLRTSGRRPRSENRPNDEARAILAECQARALAEKATTVGTVWLAAALGELDQAWSMYYQADEERQDLSLFLLYAGYDPMRSDPRFASLPNKS